MISLNLNHTYSWDIIYKSDFLLIGSAILILGAATPSLCKILNRCCTKLKRPTMQSSKVNAIAKRNLPMTVEQELADFQRLEALRFNRPFQEKRELPLQLYHSNRSRLSATTKNCIQRLYEIIEQTLPNYQLSDTVDDGNCFWDGFSQGLQAILKRKISIGDLRAAVKQHILDLKPAEERLLANSYIDPEFGMFPTYDLWKQHVLSIDYFTEKPPSWGNAEFIGKILCQIYHVSLRKIEVGSTWESDTTMFKIENQPTVTLAVYPDHFLAVLPKTLEF